MDKEKKLLSEDELLKVSGGTLPKELNEDSCFQTFGGKENKKKDCELTLGCQWVEEVDAFGFVNGYCMKK